MKVILFLAAVYALIINQCYQQPTKLSKLTVKHQENRLAKSANDTTDRSTPTPPRFTLYTAASGLSSQPVTTPAIGKSY